MNSGTKLKLILFIAMALIGCSDNSSNNSIKPYISSIEPLNASPGDVITIFGSNLGYNPANSKVFLSGNEITSDKAIKWNNSFIRINLPLNAKSGKIYIVSNSDTSNFFDYNIASQPSIEMVSIPAGEFIMGSETGFGYERPAHIVKISKPFEIGKFEITQKIWQLVMNYNNSNVQSDNLPVMNITWDDAIVFCNRLSKIIGLDTVYITIGNSVNISPTADGYRLPTEAEWEYACRAGSTGDYPGTGVIDAIAWFNGNSAYNPHPVGTKKANSWNIFDMNGNVWEWCWDWYDGNYYSVSPVNDPQGPVSGTRHVLRGGSCGDGATYARSANRTYLHDDFINCGLRIVKNKL